ncbi:UNVERIFIED_CONTAM: Retrovirus-related Pol polyprotein from transposon TNT 1-94 [Sesamum angustifolium]|uniref:Retrovirus-related Pol polyprotein from transposon TNT 1-94 n=1 Tax=Sesamum angustifolium TaxID=2727405 RepID=A0AAW2NYA5_9LAMI
MRRSKHGGIPCRRYEIEGKYLMCAFVDTDEPTTYEEVVTSPNANEWITAIKEEMSSMAKNNVWELVDLPSGRKTIGKKWVLKTTFLNGELDEEIYMDQPEGLPLECLRLVGYSDADGSADRDERKSTSRYAFLLGGTTITWCNEKQACISLSTMEAEYVASTPAIQEAIWLRRFLKSLHILAHINDVVVIYCDNSTTIAYAKDPKYQGRTKHIDTIYHLIRDSIGQREVVLRHIPTNDMIVDPFTRPLRRDAFHRHALIGPLTWAIALAL